MEDRVFFCFSGKDRLVYAQSLNFHLKNLGIEVWYDYEKLYLGDDGDYVNIEEDDYSVDADDDADSFASKILGSSDEE